MKPIVFSGFANAPKEWRQEMHVSFWDAMREQGVELSELVILLAEAGQDLFERKFMDQNSPEHFADDFAKYMWLMGLKPKIHWVSAEDEDEGL